MLVTNDGVQLLVGFTAGQVQLIDPIKKELSKLFNEEVLACYFVFFPGGQRGMAHYMYIQTGHFNTQFRQKRQNVL
ncbi:hypothetical protein DPMN_095860 [Dreissena polymorpha]|uniref:Uncharacterized protein n=1 Tax=Dreissena polymorpha TaxID=45954 RepID=A0A9D4L8Q7_DREPO|nr:hypothetical protein DPMN_095860 [Dreissena polymorpha]